MILKILIKLAMFCWNVRNHLKVFNLLGFDWMAIRVLLRVLLRQGEVRIRWCFLSSLEEADSWPLFWPLRIVITTLHSCATKCSPMIQVHCHTLCTSMMEGYSHPSQCTLMHPCALSSPHCTLVRQSALPWSKCTVIHHVLRWWKCTLIHPSALPWSKWKVVVWNWHGSQI